MLSLFLGAFCVGCPTCCTRAAGLGVQKGGWWWFGDEAAEVAYIGTALPHSLNPKPRTRNRRLEMDVHRAVGPLSEEDVLESALGSGGGVVCPVVTSSKEESRIPPPPQCKMAHRCAGKRGLFPSEMLTALSC